QARLHLPAGALIRQRAGSARVAMLFRAADGEPGKRVVNGDQGKIEVLGAGQQAMVHGLHPTGSAVTWSGGRGPDTVPLRDLPAVTESVLDVFLCACAPLLGAAEAPEDGTTLRSRLPASGFTLPSWLSPTESTLCAGIEPLHWFSSLQPKEMSDAV